MDMSAHESKKDCTRGLGESRHTHADDGRLGSAKASRARNKRAKSELRSAFLTGSEIQAVPTATQTRGNLACPHPLRESIPTPAISECSTNHAASPTARPPHPAPDRSDNNPAPRAQAPEKQNLPRRRLQQIGPAHNFGDPHRSIVDHNRQLVGRNIIAPPHNEVPKIAPRHHPLRPQMQIGETRSPRHPERETASSLRQAWRSIGDSQRCGDGRLGRPARAKPSGPAAAAAAPAGTSPDTPAHHPLHSALPPPAPHPSANRCTDR